MGSVVLAEDSWRDGLEVALKLAPWDDAGHRRALEREYLLLSSLRHPFVVAAIGFGACHETRQVWLAMEHAAGPNLAAAAAGLALRERAALAQQVSRALDFVHARGWIHGDVKEENVVVVREGDAWRVRLIDFGLARREGEAPLGRGVSGTLSHAAPEVLAGTAADHRSDLYALGIMLYALLSGRRPFDDADPLALVQAHRQRDPPPLASLIPGLPRGAADLVHRLLAKSPADRPGSAAAVSLALGRAFALPADETDDAARAWAVAPRLVARDEALGVTEGLLARAVDPRSAGPGVAWLVGGEGQGKSRLLDALAARARVARAVVLRGAPGAEPSSLLAEPLADAVRLLGADSEVVSRHAAVLAPILPRLAAGPPSEVLPHEESLAAAAAGIWEILCALGPRPVLLLLDDVDHADADDVRLVEMLARRIALEERRGQRAPMALVAALDEARGAAASQLGSSPGAWVCLAPLEASAQGALLRDMFPGLGEADELAALVRREAGASGRVLEEWSAELIHRGLLRRTASGFACDLDAPAARTPPPGAEEVARRSLGGLPGVARVLLTALSAMPAPAEPMAVAAAAGVPRDEAEGALFLLERRGLIRVLPSPTGPRAEPASEPLRRAARAGGAEEATLAGRLLDAPAVVAELGPADRAYLALAAGRRALARDLLAQGLAEAEARRDVVRAARLAGRLAELQDDPRERRQALRRRARALIDADRLDDAELQLSAIDVASDDLDRAEHLLLAGRLAHRAGRIRQAIETLDEAHAAASLARAAVLSDVELELARALGVARDPRALPLLQTVLQRPEIPPRQRLAAELVRAAFLLREQRDVEAAKALLSARSRAHEQGEVLQEAVCDNNLGIVALRTGDLAAAGRRFASALRLRRRVGARAGMASTLSNLALVDMRRGHPRAAALHARAAAELHEEIGSVRGALVAVLNEAAAALQAEDLPASRQALVRARELSAQAQDPGLSAQVGLIDAACAHLSGRLADAVAIARATRDAAVAARDEVAQVEAEAIVARAAPSADEARALARRICSGPAESSHERLALLVAVERLAGVPSAWLSPWAPQAAPDALDEARAAARATLERLASASAVDPAERLAAALVGAALGVPDGVSPAEVRSRIARAEAASAGALLAPGLRAHLLAARSWVAWRLGDAEAAEAALEEAVALLRRHSRGVAAEEREAFLARPDRAAFREALLQLRRERVGLAGARGWDRLVRAGERKPAQPLRAARIAEGKARREHALARRRAERLAEILEVSRGITALLPVDELLARVLGSAMKFMDADRGFIVLVRPDRSLRFATARDRTGRSVPRAEFAVSHSVLDEVVRTGQSVLSSDAREDERFVSKASVLALDLRSVLVAPLVASSEVIGAIYLDNLQESGVFGEQDLELLGLLAAQAAVAVENARLHAAELEKERIDRELTVARSIQQSLLPRELPTAGAFRLAAVMQPARELGGDWYDIVPQPDGGFLLTVGDVSGKGVGAALFMVMARTILRASQAGAGLDAWLTDANEAIAAQIDDDKFLTLLAVRAGGEARTVRHVLAGHEPPIVYRAADGSAAALPEGGLALGMLPDISGRLEERRTELAPGDLLACVSDGVTECRSPLGELFGRARLRDVVAAHGALGAEAVMSRLLRELDAWRGGAERSDDITVVVLEAARGDASEAGGGKPLEGDMDG